MGIFDFLLSYYLPVKNEYEELINPYTLMEEELIKDLEDKENYTVEIPEQIKNEEENELLIKILRDKNSLFRWCAAEKLGKPGESYPVIYLMEALEDKDNFLRYHAAEALGEIGDPISVDALTGKLYDEDSILQLYAAEALGKIGDVRAAEALVGKLSDMDELVVDYTVEALLNTGKPALPYLLRALKHESWKVRLNSIEIIKKIKDKSLVEPLIETLNDIYEIRIKTSELLREYVIPAGLMGFNSIEHLYQIIAGEERGKDEAIKVLRELLISDSSLHEARITPSDIAYFKKGMNCLKEFREGYTQEDERRLTDIFNGYFSNIKDIFIFPQEEVKDKDIEITGCIRRAII